MEGEPWASYVLEVHVLKQPSNPSGACFVDEQVADEHDVYSYSASLHNVDSNTTGSPRVCLLEYVEGLLQLVEMKGADL